MASLTLEHRAVLRVGGTEGPSFLQRIVTADLDALREGVAMPSALLSPQGKVMHEFLVSHDVDALRLDVSRAFLPDFARRLMLYRLHADVTFEPRPGATVRALWGEDAAAGLADRRFPPGTAARAYEAGEETGTLAEWTRLRIAHGVAEIGTDFGADSLFPHDLGMPATGGVSVRKGCFVGQEVVSRMHHRGTGRRAVATVRGEAPLPAPGTALTADGRPLGTLGGALDRDGIAVLRVDRLEEARAAGHPVLVDGVAVIVTVHDRSDRGA